MDAETVGRAWLHVGQIAVPDLVGVFGKLDALQFTFAAAVENADFNFRRISGEHRKVRTLAVPCGPSGMGVSFLHSRGFDFNHADSNGG